MGGNMTPTEQTLLAFALAFTLAVLFHNSTRKENK